MSLLKVEEGFARDAKAWPFDPVCVVSGESFSMAEDGYVTYGIIGGDATVERMVHFALWDDLKSEDDVVGWLDAIVSILETEPTLDYS